MRIEEALASMPPNPRTIAHNKAKGTPVSWVNWTEGRQYRQRYTLPVFSEEQEAAYLDRFHSHPSKRRVSVSKRRPRNAREVPNYME